MQKLQFERSLVQTYLLILESLVEKQGAAGTPLGTDMLVAAVSLSLSTMLTQALVVAFLEFSL